MSLLLHHSLATASRARRKSSQGFTLIELLVVISIIAMLISILLPALGAARTSAEQVAEMAAARQLAQVQVMYADDYDGYYISADYQPSSDVTVSGFNGVALSPFDPSRGRYPYRLGGYLNGVLKGLTHVGDTLQYIEIGSPTSTDIYIGSLAPSFGLNGEYVGGMYLPHTSISLGQGAAAAWRPEMVLRPGVEAISQSGLIAFASARSYTGPGSTEYFGYYYVRAPYGYANTDWSASDYDRYGANATDWGRVDPRYHDAAVVGFTDGHAETMKLDALRDMRLWSNEARRANDPNYNPN